MRKPFQLLFLLLGVLIFAPPQTVVADEITDDEFTTQSMQRHRLLMSKAAKLRTSVDPDDPDTVWIGHINDPTWVPKSTEIGRNPSSSDPTGGTPLVGAAVGGYGPYKIGRGMNIPGSGPGNHFNGVWTFDHFQAGEVDSLQGWWPVARPFQSGDGFGATDDKVRPFFGLDYGNGGNYVINQGGALLKRTFGVTGYWHRDPGNTAAPAYVEPGDAIPGPNVEWAPLGGSASAWCGLRAHADLNAQDLVANGGTGNYFNQTIIDRIGNNSHSQIGSISVQGTDKNFPGYGSQWDQMLYRDVNLGGGDALAISFKYVTGLSNRRAAGLATNRIGYFWKDPLKTVALNDGNFISATDAEAAAAGPMDSFSVYVGVPVEPVAGPAPVFADYVASDGVGRDIFDVKRRWFSEVIKTNGPMLQVLAVSGLSGAPAPGNPPTTVNFAQNIPNAGALAGIIAAGGGKVRIVFRIKTNRGTDDEDNFVSGHTSFTRGAAIVDDVVVNGWAAANGNFEAADAINNDAAVTALTAWKSTGKPPGIYVHTHTVDQTVVGAAQWNDPCSPPNDTDPSSPNRACSMLGNVLSGGDHDVAEKPGGTFGGPDQDRARLAVSPTIQFVSDGVNPYNGVGLSDAIINNRTEYALWFDIHSAGFRGTGVNGNFRAIGFQAYPAIQRNGIKVWGEARFPPAITFSTTNSCAANFIAIKSAGLVGTSNASGIPDSVRIQFQYLSRCYTTALTGTQCSPNAGIFVGQYIDNISLALIRGVPPAGLSVFPWFWYVDAFPSNTTGNFASANFDTTAALVKSAINRAPLTTNTRPAVLGDSAQVTTGLVPGVRLDLVFRILPGVGNYVTIGNRGTALRKVPTAVAAASANAASTNFWESYLGNNGAKGTPGGHAGGVWSPDVWNSARMDTMENNTFPALSLGTNLNTLDAANWQTTYHETDPKYATLGIAKNRCFVVDPSAGKGVGCSSKNPTSTTQCNHICGTVPSAGSFVGDYPPAWTEDLNSGVPLTENGLPPGQTYEFTKIIPDGQLTPGAHVQYFFRREPGSAGPLDVDQFPDTNQVFDGAQADGQRWFHFSVLPDRWKDPAFGAGGTGMACMLVVDIHERAGDEFRWVQAADSIGLTATAKQGAHNGFTATGGINTPGTFSEATARASNGGQPGSSWDLFNVKAGESSTTGSAWLTNRLAIQPGGGELLAGKQATTGATPDQLTSFYRHLVLLTGTLNNGYFGRVSNRTEDDLGMMNQFAISPTGTAKPRSVYVIGQGFAEACNALGAVGTTFLNTYFATLFTSNSYRTFSGNPKPVSALDAAPGSVFDLAGAGIGLQGVKLGTQDGCGIENDVLNANSAVITGAAVQTFHEDPNTGDGIVYGASVFAPVSPGVSREHVTYLDGSRITRIGSFANVLPTGRPGFRAYMYKALSITQGALGCGPQGAPVGVGDGAGSGDGYAFVNFMNLKSANPMRAGEARFAFGLARTERVEVKVYDVTGRLVKTVANRQFAGGQEHVVTWDGSDELGNKVNSGVYFYQLKTPTWTSQKKLAVLSN